LNPQSRNKRKKEATIIETKETVNSQQNLTLENICDTEIQPADKQRKKNKRNTSKHNEKVAPQWDSDFGQGPLMTPNSLERQQVRDKDANVFKSNRRSKQGSSMAQKSTANEKKPMVTQAAILQNQQALSQMIPELRNAVQGRKKMHGKIAKKAADIYFKGNGNHAKPPLVMPVETNVKDVSKEEATADATKAQAGNKGYVLPNDEEAK